MRWVSIIFKAYAEANNKFLKPFVPNKPRSYIIYLDTNNLYSHSMMQLLPNEIFDWINPEKFILDTYFDNNPLGSFLEANRDYSDELHDSHNGYPLADEKVKIIKEILSEHRL